MKTYKNLYPDICSYANLYAAWRAAARGKRHAAGVATFEYALTDSLLRLEDELRTQTYRPGPYRHFRLTDPKPRRISAAPFRDRVVHHALVQRLEPIFEARFIADSYACRRGKGTHAALQRCQVLAAQARYVLQGDIVQFFPAVDHAILRALLQRTIADARTHWLMEQILASGAGVLKDEYSLVYFPGDDLLSALRPRGLPIGNLTSQFWANCYLNSLDQFVKRQLQCRAYLRYVDDFLLFSDSKRRLWQWKHAIVEHLAGLRLTLHARSSTVYPVRHGIPFLGFVTYPTHRLLKRRNGLAFARRFREQVRQLQDGLLEFDRLTAAVHGWLAHAAHGHTYGLRRALVSSHVIPRGTAWNNRPSSRAPTT
ncbi:MAG: reverse transcriptase domain-containing protein [Candidatus Tectimicrobiota bacterium]